MHGESAAGRARRTWWAAIAGATAATSCTLGILIYFVAFAGMAFKVQREATLKPGESVELQSPFGHTYTFTHVGISQFKQFNRYVSAATIEVARDGVPVGRIVSEKRQHFTVNELGPRRHRSSRPPRSASAAACRKTSTSSSRAR